MMTVNTVQSDTIPLETEPVIVAVIKMNNQFLSTSKHLIGAPDRLSSVLKNQSILTVPEFSLL